MPYRDRQVHRQPPRRRGIRRRGPRGRRAVIVMSLLFVVIICIIAGLIVTSCHARADLEGNGLSVTDDSRTDAGQTEAQSGTPTGDRTASEQTHDGAVMLDVPYLSQFPDLPTGCEVTAATMALDYYGYSAAATDVDDFLAKSDYTFTSDDEGNVYGPDPDLVFIGNTRSYDGSFCNPGPIVAALDAYITSVGGNHHAEDITGTSPEGLYQLVAGGTPVVVWVTTYLQELTVDDTWYSASGSLVQLSTTDHAMVLIGYDPTQDTVTFNDPIDDASVTYSRVDFETVYRSRGQRAVIITS